MKLLMIALALLGCRGADKPPDLTRWPEVERLAAPTVPASDSTVLAEALALVTDSDVPEQALALTIAWRKAGGGLPWRSAIAVGDPRVIRVARLGNALVERRPDDPEAIHAALYLGHRLRAEGGSLIEAAIGFELAKRVVALGTPPAGDARALAPTEAEVRRALAVDARQLARMLDEQAAGARAMLNEAKRAYIVLVVDAPAERAAFIKHVAARVAEAQKSTVLSLIFSPRQPKLAGEMFETIDAYRAWLGR